MKLAPHSIFITSIRSFCAGLCAMIGIAIGLVLLLLFFTALISKGSAKELTSKYSVEVLAGPDGTREALSESQPVILQVNISGPIGMGSMTGKSIREMLVESREGHLKHGRVKAVLLDINTPGGTVVSADDIYRALKEYKQEFKVPVYAYVDGLCASGGVYISCAADKIYSSGSSLVGSVGVLAQFFNATDLLDKIGVKALSLTAGNHKDDMSPFHSWTKEEEARIDAIVKFYYEQFVDLVVSKRKGISKEALVSDYGAQVFPAAVAQKYGFIDVSGVEKSEAVRQLALAADISEKTPYQLVTLQEKKWLSDLIEARSTLFTGKCTHQIELPGGMSIDAAHQFFYLYKPGN